MGRMVDHQADEIDIAAGSLDDPNSVRPGFRLYAGEAPEWQEMNDDLPKYDALRPTTRGLPPGTTEV